ncbi:MAG: BatA domain-containing protein [Planctomycetota bacterium]|jgi:uncharacterized membrane protein
MLDFLNPWMLAGLAGVALPVIAHLLSRRKHDVVSWGAMQFLELSQTTRRRVQLEELLLLLLRMAMIALVAIALARPWMSGNIAAMFSPRPASDVVIVLDSSYSTGWAGNGRTPHQAARAWSRSLVNGLATGDAVGFVDCRETPAPVLDSPTHDFARMHSEIEELPAPTASGRLSDSILKAFQLTSTGTNLSRHIVVITDGQQQAWHGVDDHFQQQLDELRKQAAVPPELWIVNARAQQPTSVNHSVGLIELSRDITVVDFPIRIRTTIRNSGGKSLSTVLTHLNVNGQRLAEQTRSVRVHPGGEAQVEFEHRFLTPGCHRISVEIDADNLTADNRSDAIVEVADAFPVLIIDGSPKADTTRSETFFARLALSPPSNPAPWIATRVVAVNDFRAASIGDAQVIVLANAKAITNEQTSTLTTFVSRGGGLLVTLGDQTKPAWYNATLFANGSGLLPVHIDAFVKATSNAQAEQPQPNSVTIADDSLQLPWISRFQAGADDGFLSARFSNWYRLLPANAVAERRKPPGIPAENDATAADDLPVPIIAARLNTGDPLLVQHQYGHGQVAVFASTLDADWTTLPAKPDYVPFLHELIFQLASSRSPRNIEVGTPIVIPIALDESAADWIALSPRGDELETSLAGNELQPLLRVDDTATPGIYRLRRRSDGDQGTDAATPDELFAATTDRSESDLTPLTDERWGELTEDDQFRLIESPDELFGAVHEQSARVEIWFGLLLLFVLFLIGEVIMTRRLVQGGHSYGPEQSA